MQDGLAVQPAGKIARPLRVLVPLIKDEIEAGTAAGMEHYRRAGEMLLEAKSQLPHGEFATWVGHNFREVSYAQARVYMKLAKESQNAGRPAFSTLTEMTHPGRTTHCAPWVAEAREVVNRVDVGRLREEARTREHEQAVLRQLAHQLIEIGYKALATKLHPDKGGSSEAMARLNRVRTVLKGAF